MGERWGDSGRFVVSVKTNVTTDGHVCNRSSRVLKDAEGLVHYSVRIDEVPDAVRDKPGHLPCIVRMCDLLAAYDRANGWYDFTYPTWYLADDQEFEGVPTCVRCSSA